MADINSFEAAITVMLTNFGLTSLTSSAIDQSPTDSPEAACVMQTPDGQPEGVQPMELGIHERQLSLVKPKTTLAVAELLQQLSSEYPDKDGDTVLHIVAARRDLQFALLWRRIFQDKFAEQLNERNHLRQTPLHVAVFVNDLPMIEFLLQNGASVTVQEREGRTPIHIACERGDIDSLRLLIQTIIQRGESTHSVLNISDFNGGLNSLLFFIHKHNPLSEAQFRIIDLLLECGADPDFKDESSGKNIVHYIAEQNNVALYNYLHEKYPFDIDWQSPRRDGCRVALEGNTFIFTKPESLE